MKNILKQEILKLKNRPHVNQEILEKFLQKLEDEKGLFRFENPQDHICAYFLPFDQNLRSVFLGYHKKAGCWIPPGGHIEERETPIETIKREFSEELAHRVTDDQIKLFDLTITDIVNPIQVCKRHWDLWHLVYVDRVKFNFDKREFYEADWFSMEKALPLIEIEDYKRTMEKLLNLF